MEKTVKQLEKNVSASFSYVKKDMLMLNDAFSDIHDKIQHLSLNHAALLEELQKLREKVYGKAASKKTAKKATAKKKTAKKTAKKATAKKKTPKKVVTTTETVYE